MPTDQGPQDQLDQDFSKLMVQAAQEGGFLPVDAEEVLAPEVELPTEVVTEPEADEPRERENNAIRSLRERAQAAEVERDTFRQQVEWFKSPQGQAWAQSQSTPERDLSDMNERELYESLSRAAAQNAVQQVTPAFRGVEQKVDDMQRTLDINAQLAGLGDEFPDFNMGKDGKTVTDIMRVNPDFNPKQAYFAGYPDRVESRRVSTERTERNESAKPVRGITSTPEPEPPKGAMERLREGALAGSPEAMSRWLAAQSMSAASKPGSANIQLG